jgi:hypothetical protein
VVVLAAAAVAVLAVLEQQRKAIAAAQPGTGTTAAVRILAVQEQQHPAVALVELDKTLLHPALWLAAPVMPRQLPEPASLTPQAAALTKRLVATPLPTRAMAGFLAAGTRAVSMGDQAL